MRSWLAALSVVPLMLTATAQAQSFPSDDAVRATLIERIEARREGVGIVVGLSEPAGDRVVAAGQFSADDLRKVDDTTLFEIGSITKVMTALLLADMALKGEVGLDDPVAKYLPEGTRVPERGGKQITLRDLATHMSGLPRMPGNFAPAYSSNPYVDYGVAQLYAFLAGYELPRDIGAEFEYSNLGAALLGHALALKAGQDYGALLAERVLVPLGMTETVIETPPELAARLAPGHDQGLSPTTNWDLMLFAPAGGVRSTVRDMLKFVRAASGAAETPLAPAFALLLADPRPMADPAARIGLGWLMLKREGDEIVWHNGGTGGYRSFAGFSRSSKIGVVALSNVATTVGVDDVGFNLLDPSLPLSPAPVLRNEVVIDPVILDRYVGQYPLAPEFVLTVRREGDGLFVQATGQDKFQVFPESETKFFYKVVDAQLSFELGPDGKAKALVLHQNGRDQPGPRVE